MKKFLSEIDYKTGQIAFLDEFLRLDLPYLEQIDILREDLLQVVFDLPSVCEYILDIGWYPSFDLDGEFKVFLIKNQNWESPISVVKTKDPCDLCSVVENAIDKIYNE